MCGFFEIKLLPANIAVVSIVCIDVSVLGHMFEFDRGANATKIINNKKIHFPYIPLLMRDRDIISYHIYYNSAF